MRAPSTAKTADGLFWLQKIVATTSEVTQAWTSSDRGSTIGPVFSMKRCRVERLDFIVAGAQKSGTTALHYFLKKHPQIALPEQQELHFFDDDEIFSRPVDYDLLHRQFRPVAGSTLLRLATARQAIAGEVTPSYLYWKPAMERIWN